MSPATTTTTRSGSSVAAARFVIGWWAECRPNYRVVTSQFVIDEVSLGDSDAAARRLEMLADAGGDLRRYFDEATERLKASGRPIAKLPKKTKQRRKKTG